MRHAHSGAGSEKSAPHLDSIADFMSSSGSSLQDAPGQVDCPWLAVLTGAFYLSCRRIP